MYEWWFHLHLLRNSTEFHDWDLHVAHMKLEIFCSLVEYWHLEFPVEGVWAREVLLGVIKVKMQFKA